MKFEIMKHNKMSNGPQASPKGLGDEPKGPAELGVGKKVCKAT